MCGRYAATRRPEDLAVEFETDPPGREYAGGGHSGAAHAGRSVAEVRPDYNAAPTRDLMVVRERLEPEQHLHRVLDVMRWGLVPSWAKDPSIGSRMINARIESVATKPSYRRALARRRCLVPADGWYEWGPPRLGEKAKQPYFMVPRDGRSLALAGLYEAWRPADSDPDTPWLVTFTVITEPAVGELREIHDRMPYALPRERWAEWLDPRTTGPEEAAALLVPTPEAYVGHLEIRPVSRLVNNVRNNGPELVERLAEHPVESSAPPVG